MKNMIKMSLVAAVAVAGLSSNVAAQPLAEAIKDVDVSGSVVYRYNDYGDDNRAGTKDLSTNNYKIATSLKSKVNDYVTATVRVVTGTGIGDNQGTLHNFGGTDNGKDLNPTLQVNQANFTVKTDVATVIAGKQGLTTPWTVAIDSDSNEQTGTGLLALVPAGPVTIAAAYFNQTNLDAAHGIIDGDENIATVGVLGTAGPVSFDAWYLDMQDSFDSFTVGAKATIEMITAELRYTSLDLDGTNQPDNNSLIAKIGAKVGPVGLGFNYGMTDKEGGLTALDSDAKTSLTGWNVNLHNKADADMFMLHADMNVMSGLNVAVNYNTIDYGNTSATETEETELYTQITHTMGKNLVTYVRFGTFEQEIANDETQDAITGRLQVEYKF